MKALFNKLILEKLPKEQEDEWNPLYKVMIKAKVLSTGSEIDFVKDGDIVVLAESDLHMMDNKKGFAVDRSLIFINDYPQPGKIHITPLKKDLNVFEKGVVVKSSVDPLLEGDEVGYVKGGIVLPDYTEIISKSQVYFKSEN